MTIAIIVVAVSREEGLEFVTGSLGYNSRLATTLLFWVAVFVFGLVTNAIIVGKVEMKRRIMPMLFAFLGIVFFQTAFTLIKTSLPYIVPFFADPYLARFDKFLHGGTQPVFLLHSIDNYFSVRFLYSFYSTFWLVFAIYFPVILAAFDGNQLRVRRFLILYALAWVFVGNVVAFAGSSVGPVYFDRAYGGTQFANLESLIISSGLNTDFIGIIQEFLWEVYSSYGQATGSGISAFPSVHVSVAAMLGLYAYERSKLLGIVGFIFCATILFLSVYSGYHYAIDGYFSIVAIFSFWLIMRRSELRANRLMELQNSPND